MKAQDAVPANPFASAREQFDRIVRDLESETTFAMTHGDLEEHLRTEGFELLRRLFQGHLDARRPGEVAETVVGADGAARTHRRGGEGRGGRGRHGVTPPDPALTLPVEQHSHGVRRRVALEATRGSFDDAVDAVRTTTAATVGKRQAGARTAAEAEGIEGISPPPRAVTSSSTV